MFNMEENDLNCLQRAFDLCNQKEYDLAKTIFMKYLKINENDYSANLGMVRALTHDYSKENVTEDFEFYFQKAFSVAPFEEKNKILKKYNTYVENLNLSQQLGHMMDTKKRSFSSNFYVFLISCCLVIGVFFFLAKSWLLGCLLFGVALLIIVINSLSNLLKRRGDKND